jgi:hypothetical protein
MSTIAAVCVGCEHDLDSHVVTVTGAVICLVTQHGVSSRGVLGIPYHSGCDCKNYHSAQRDRVIAEREAERSERERMFDSLRRSMAKDLGLPEESSEDISG